MKFSRLLKVLSLTGVLALLLSAVSTVAFAAKNIDGTYADGSRVNNTSVILIFVAAAVALVLLIVVAAVFIRRIKEEHDMQKTTETIPLRRRNKPIPLTKEQDAENAAASPKDESTPAEDNGTIPFTPHKANEDAEDDAKGPREE